MTKEQVLTAMRKNWVSITFGVVAILAIVLMFVIVNPWLDSVKAEVQTSAGKQSAINGLLTEPRPAIDVTISGARASDANLAMFPTQRVIQSSQQTMDAVVAQANEVLTRAIEVNRRAPLGFDTYEAGDAAWPLEGPARAVDRDGFRRAYAARVNADNAFNSEAGDYPAGTLQAELQATRPPTPEELQAADVALEAVLRAEAENAGQAEDAAAFNALLATRRVEQANAVKAQRASRHQLYIDANGPTTGLTVHPLATAESASADDCFNAQMGLWVQETVLFNLQRANEGTASQLAPEQRNLLNNPVKHVMAITLPATIVEPAGSAADGGAAGGNRPAAGNGNGGAGGGFGGFGGGTRGGNQPANNNEGGGEVPEEEAAPAIELPVEPGAAIERDFSISPSGRPLHTPFYDIVQFTLTLRCSAADVPYVLGQLQRDSFVTVLNVNMTAVDLALAARQGYVYGQRPVVELDLQCEMTFLRPWTASLMPNGIRAALANAGEDTGSEE